MFRKKQEKVKCFKPIELLVVIAIIGIAVAPTFINTKVLAIESSLVFNEGIGGNNTYDILARLDSDVLSHQPDLVVMMIGTNDVLNSGNSVPLDQYEANLTQLVQRITNSGSQLAMMTILPCYEPYLLERHPASFYGDDGPNGRVKLANVAVQQVAATYGIPVVDTYTLFELYGNVGETVDSLIRNEVNSGMRDGVHPTPEGYDLIGNAVADTIDTYNLPTSKVVCVGDSITYGAYVVGAGTATGETYPSVLSQRLNADTYTPAIVNGDFEAEPFGDGWNSSVGAMSEHRGLVAGGLDKIGSKSALMYNGVPFQSDLAIGPQWQLDLLFASDTVTADRSLNFALRYTGGAINFRLGASGNLEAYDQDLGWRTISTETVSLSQDVDRNGSFADAGDILNVYSLRLVGDFSAETPYYDVYLSDANSSELDLIASNVELWQFADPTSKSLIYDMTLVGTGSNYLIDGIVLESISTPKPVPGDANRDGKVDGSDVTILAGNWQAGVNPGDDAATWDMGDFNGDGKVDGSDVTILAGNWQSGVTTAAASVPEPGTFSILLGAIVVLFTGLRVRRNY